MTYELLKKSNIKNQKETPTYYTLVLDLGKKNFFFSLKL